MAKKMVRK